MATERVLTTVDNPYNPFEDYDTWYAYDTKVLRYNTCGVLDRMFNYLKEDSDYYEFKTDDELYDEAMRRLVIMQPDLYRIVDGAPVS